MKKLKLLIAGCLAITAVTTFSAFKPENGTGYKVGDKAIDFNLKNIDGKMVSMAGNTKAKGYIIAFTCNHCPFAIAYEERIIALDKKYAAKGYPVLAINPNDAIAEPVDSYENMQARAKEKGFTFAYLVDDTQEIAKAYGATRTPHMFIVTKKGNDFVVDYVGAIDDNSNDAKAVKTKYLENAMDEILAGKPVTTASTKAIGCTIKWKKA